MMSENMPSKRFEIEGENIGYPTELRDGCSVVGITVVRSAPAPAQELMRTAGSSFWKSRPNEDSRRSLACTTQESRSGDSPRRSQKSTSIEKGATPVFRYGDETRSLRRRVTLMFAGCSVQSRMTLLRREGCSLVSRVEKAIADLRKESRPVLEQWLRQPCCAPARVRRFRDTDPRPGKGR